MGLPWWELVVVKVSSSHPMEAIVMRLKVTPGQWIRDFFTVERQILTKLQAKFASIIQ